MTESSTALQSAKIHQEMIEISTSKKCITDITHQVSAAAARSGVQSGLCTLFIQHTSASLVIQENADPAVLRDLGRWMSEQVPESRDWEHDDEGPDDMPAHVRSAITHTSETIPIMNGRLALGVWQAIYLWEHRTHPHNRRIVVHIAGM